MMRKFYNLAFLLGAFLCAGLVSGQTTIASQSFESSGSDNWSYTPNPAAGSFTSSGDEWDVVTSLGSLSDMPSNGSSFFGGVDIANSDNPNATFGELEFSSVSVSGFSNVQILFDYEVDGFDAADDIDYTVTIDGVAQSEVKLVDGNSNFSEFATATINIPDGSANVSIVVKVTQNGGSDFVGLDNFRVEGITAGSPSVGFDSTASTENETNTSFNVNIPVTLSNYDGNQVDLNVSVNALTAESGDYTLNTTSLTFTADGTQNVSIDINPDAGFEDETLEITLTESSSTGITISPDTHTLTIVDDESAPLVINEIVDDPDGTTGDANGDGTVSTTQDEFVEIYNNSSSSIDMSGYELSDGNGVRHIFPSGTILLANQAIVIFGGGDVADFTGVPGLVQTASTGQLGLNNGSDTISISNGSGTTLVSESYSGGGNDQSLAREPDFTGSFVLHSSITSNPVDFSPGSDNTDGSSLTDPNTWTGATDTDWATGSNWVNGIAPRSIDDILIPNGLTNYPVISSTTGGVGNDLTVEGAASLTINGGGSLILNGASVGNVTYNIAIPDTNWHLIGAPVSGQDYDSAWFTANNIASGTGSNRGVSTYINTTDGDGDWVYAQDGATGTFANTSGYSVLTNAAGDISLTGNLLTNNLAVPITSSPVAPGVSNSNNLVGNPFAAYVSIDDFLTLGTNSAALEDVREAVYVWDGSAYLPLTTGFIHPGQGFFLSSASASESVDINENMLSHQTGVTFFNTPTNDATINLIMAVGNEARSTRVNFIDGKTTGLDPRFDVATFTGQTAGLEIYTALVDGSYQDTNFALQALPETDLDNMVIPVGVTASAGEAVSIVAEINGLPVNTNVYLEDRSNGTYTLLGNGNSFDFTAAGDMTGFGRFYLHTTTQTLSNEIITQNLDVTVFQSDLNTLSISGLNGSAASFQLYDLLGKRVISENLNENSVQATIDISNIKSGVYIAQLASGDEATSIKLIINK